MRCATVLVGPSPQPLIDSAAASTAEVPIILEFRISSADDQEEDAQFTLHTYILLCSGHAIPRYPTRETGGDIGIF